MFKKRDIVVAIRDAKTDENKGLIKEGTIIEVLDADNRRILFNETLLDAGTHITIDFRRASLDEKTFFKACKTPTKTVCSIYDMARKDVLKDVLSEPVDCKVERIYKISRSGITKIK